MGYLPKNAKVEINLNLVNNYLMAQAPKKFFTSKVPLFKILGATIFNVVLNASLFLKYLHRYKTITESNKKIFK